MKWRRIHKITVGAWAMETTELPCVRLYIARGPIIPLTAAEARNIADRLHDAADQLDANRERNA